MATLLALSLACIACSDRDAPTAVGPAPGPELVWTAHVADGPVDETHVDAEGGVLVVEPYTALRQRRLVRFGPSGEDWTLFLDGSTLIDLEATSNGFVVLATVGPDGARFGNVEVDPTVAKPGTAVTVEIGLDGGVGGIETH